MSIPDAFALRLHAYTLACRELLLRYADLEQATLADSQFSCEHCIVQFDDALRIFFKGDESDNAVHAAEQINDQLRVRANSFRRRSSDAAAIFDAITNTVAANMEGWSYVSDLEVFHQLGRDLAQQFFQTSPWTVTQARLDIACSLNYQFNQRRAEGVALSYQPTTRQIAVRLTPEHGFQEYLALPYQFMHEYTAHVYAVDNNRNPLFNDGWMMYAAAAFFREQGYPYSIQANLFFEHLLPTLNDNSKRFARFAEDFDHWLGGVNVNSFARITHEIAAFQSSPQQDADWINNFLCALWLEFYHGDRVALQKIVENGGMGVIGRYLRSCPKVNDHFEKTRPTMKPW